MRTIVKLVLLAGVVAGAVVSAPDVMRYLKIRQM